VARPRVRINLDSAAGAALVRRLANDQAFYDEFKANPQAVLAANGVNVAGVPAPTAADVPPQAEIKQAIAAADAGTGLVAGGGLKPSLHPIFKALFAFPMSGGD
jgi:hypothetical protein